MKRFLMPASICLAAATAALVLFGCVEQRSAKSLVQPAAMPKAAFTGAWYYKTTVLDHPFEAKFTFAGEESPRLEKIRWLIAEEFLYALRAYETTLQTEAGRCAPAGDATYNEAGGMCYEDSGCDAGGLCVKNGLEYFNSPVAAYRIESHFDIQRQYNPNTGEETGAIEENTTDRLWWQREYMRVDWSQNLITDRFHFLKESADPAYAKMRREPVSFYDKDSLVVTADYIDVVNREVVSPTPESAALESSYPIATDPMTVTLRHSFLKVTPNDYRPAVHGDSQFEHFAFFRLDFEGYDMGMGLTDLARDFRINRFDIFKRWIDDTGAPIPVKDREIRRIVFYLSKGFPANLRETAYALARDWDAAFREALAGMLEAEGQTPDAAKEWLNGKIDTAANNGLGALVVRLRDHDECDDTRQSGVVDETGARVLRDPEKCAKNQGDLRYNFLWWLTKPMAGAPLEYAAFSADPETGETINANVNIYGAALEIYKSQSMLFYDIIKGRVVDGTDITESIARGDDIGAYLDGRRGGPESATLPEGPVQPAQYARSAIDSILAKVKAAAAPGMSDSEAARLLTTQNYQQMTAAHRLGAAFGDAHPEVESLLLPGDLLVTRGFDVSNRDAGGLSAADLERWSPLRGGRKGADNPWNAGYAKSRFNCLLEPNEFTDWAVWKLVQTYAVGKGYSREQVADVVENALFRQAAGHAFGHALGLRHNFEGSADHANYFDRYWEIHKAVIGAAPGILAAPECEGVSTLSDFNLFHAPESFPDASSFDLYQKQWRCFRTLMAKEGAGFYQYSSIMDYPVEFLASGFGGVETGDPSASLGKYDVAAIKFGYGGVTERWGTPTDAYDKKNRKNARYYKGGEDCGAAACPSAADGQTCLTGVCRPLVVQGAQIWDGGERCRDNAQCPGFKDGQSCAVDASYPPVCSESYQDADYSKDEQAEGNPVRYRMCSDERTADRPFCNRWDAGATSREIVANAVESYERNYVFNNFRRYRRNFGFDYEDKVFGRYFATIGKQYQGMLYNYFYVQGMRAPSSYTKPGGLIDMYFASADGLNFFNTVLGTPDIGAYVKNLDPNDKRFYRVSPDPQNAQADCTVHWGEGKYYWNRYDTGHFGEVDRLAVIGMVVDRIAALDALTSRDLGLPTADNNRFMLSYFDFFPTEILDILAGIIADDPQRYGQVVDVNPDNKHCVATPRNAWYGGLGLFNQPISPRNPGTAYRNAYVIDPGASINEQVYAITFAFERLQTFYDPGFNEYLAIWIKGEDGVFDLLDPANLCEYVSPFPSFFVWRGLRMPLAFSTGGSVVTKEQSIACALIDRAEYLKGCYGDPGCPGGYDSQGAFYELQSVESLMKIMRAFRKGYRPE
ncbi:MAG: hypothetical protein HY897_05575 [Deltaproteobacteria bacterium]|nr:hypothetical protein [Deltaproteobacteria bacterium]